ncbi:MAG: hypothetical protein IT441_04110 [Phycisphaeraceae bacterium]|nr:hypothetical protein [Phycisphaeraceae bacterium]
METASPIKAKIRQGYLLRLLILTVACLAGSVWFLYDGYVAYPHQNQMLEAYLQIQKAYPDNADLVTEEWQRQAAENGWPIDFSGPAPGKAHSSNDILVQRALGFSLVPLAIWIGLALLSHANRWVKIDNDALITSRGQRIDLSQIARLDKRRWQSKGIAVVQDRQDRRIVLDDWKYDREPTSRIVEEIEKHLTPEQIALPANPSASTARTNPSATDKTQA